MTKATIKIKRYADRIEIVSVEPPELMYLIHFDPSGRYLAIPSIYDHDFSLVQVDVVDVEVAECVKQRSA